MLLSIELNLHWRDRRRPKRQRNRFEEARIVAYTARAAVSQREEEKMNVANHLKDLGTAEGYVKDLFLHTLPTCTSR
ncbi:unnamed protein product, partial [Iphiclides podalirius]